LATEAATRLVREGERRKPATPRLAALAGGHRQATGDTPTAEDLAETRAAYPRNPLTDRAELVMPPSRTRT